MNLDPSVCTKQRTQKGGISIILDVQITREREDKHTKVHMDMKYKRAQ